VNQEFRHRSAEAGGMTQVDSTGRTGGVLRAARLRHGLSLEDVAASLRIRRVYLAAIEDSRWNELPGTAYAIGFVRTYARAVGLDSEEIARRFRDERAGVDRRTELVFPAPPKQGGTPVGALVLSGLVLAGGAYGGWYWFGGSPFVAMGLLDPPALVVVGAPREVPGTSSGSPPQLGGSPGSGANSASSPPIGGAPLASPQASLPLGESDSGTTVGAVSPTGTVMPVPPQPPAVSPPLPNPDGIVVGGAVGAPTATYGQVAGDDGRILLRARADSWIQVRERNGGPVLFNRVLRSGETYAVPGRTGLTLTTGNAGGLEVVVDGRVVSPLGALAAVRRDVPLEADRLRDPQPAAR